MASPKAVYTLDGKGVLDDEANKANDAVGESTRKLGLFPQTPKYFQDSAETGRLARFFIAKSLEDELTAFYGANANSNYIIQSLRDKGFFDFLLTSISDSSQDRYQLTETMGDNYVLYGFNKAPEILTCTGILKNTIEDDWKVLFLEFFKKIGGISSLAKFYKKSVANYVSFKYDSYIKRGALLNVSHNLTANQEMDISFSFSFIVTKTFTFSQNQKTYDVNRTDATEKGIIDGEINAIRNYTASAGTTLEPKNTAENPLVNRKALATTKEKVLKVKNEKEA